MSSLQGQIELLTMQYKRAKRCNDYLCKLIPFENVQIDKVKNAMDAIEYVADYNKRVDKLIDQMYESCENRFMIDRVRLMKLSRNFKK